MKMQKANESKSTEKGGFKIKNIGGVVRPSPQAVEICNLFESMANDLLKQKKAANKGVTKKVVGKTKTAPTRKVLNKVVQDANGDEITFIDLKDNEGITTGDKAEINDKPATGEYVMPDGSTYVFSNGVLRKVIPDRAEGIRNYLAKKRNKTNPTATPENRFAGIRERLKESKTKN